MAATARARLRQDCMRYDLPDIKIRAFKRSTFAQRSRKPRIKSWVARTLRNPSYLSSTEEKRKGKGLKNRFYHRQCLPFTGIAHQNNQTLYGQNNQTVVRFTTTSEAKSDRNRRNRQNTGYFPGIPGFFQVYPQNTGYFADFAEFGGKPASDSAQSSKN